MKQRVLGIVIMAVLMLAAWQIPGSAWAEDYEGFCGKTSEIIEEGTDEGAGDMEEPESAAVSIGGHMTWTLDTDSKVLTIMGTGEMEDYTAAKPAPWTKYQKNIKMVRVMDGVESLGNYAFYGCKGIDLAEIPASVTEPGESIFCEREEFVIDTPSGSAAEAYAKAQGFKVTDKDISKLYPRINYSAYSYSGKEIKPPVRIYGLSEGIDFKVSYEASPIELGIHEITIEGLGKYSGSASISYEIKRKSIASKALKISPNSYVYNGTERKPAVGLSGLVLDRDFTVKYKNNINAGTATVTVTGIGNYSGSLSQTYTIEPAVILLSALSFNNSIYRTYTGSAIKPSATLSGLVKGRDYTVSYSSCTAVGWAKVTIAGKGNYTGKIVKAYYIKPKTAAIAELDEGRETLKVTMKTKVKATGGRVYKIAYREAGSSVWKFKTTTKKSVTLKELKAGKKYQVMVKAYRIKNGYAYSGDWSSIKTSDEIKKIKKE